MTGTDNLIHIDRDYIAGISRSFGAQLHRHPMLEIYASSDGRSHLALEEGSIKGKIIAVGAGTVHAISDRNKYGIAIFLDPLSEYGYSLSLKILKGKPYSVINCDADFSGEDEDIREGKVKLIADRILALLEVKNEARPFSPAVIEAIDILGSGKCSFDMDDLAGEVFLSKSRLAHLFSGETGITLKEYIQLKRLESACRMMLNGSNITEAAMDTGFSGSSHIATSSMKLTGMQLRKLLSL
ncbi:MAG: helix-turn-helix transcriptional regulator [Oscillospiraceae bacterium]|nr:helix-turn-helix transcriptional regulator [Oscillospiraceae bacterium]